MKHLITLFLILATGLPCHAAPRNCRLTARVHRAHFAANAKLSNNAKSNLVITAFAVPVAVPVAPFAPYWYGVSDYHDATSLRCYASLRTAVEAMPRDTQREAEPRSNAFPRGAWEREASVVQRHCGACHGAVSPEQGVSLVDPSALSAEDRLRAIRAVITGAMPPDTEPKISNADRDSIIRELLGETDESDDK
jgi:mono/diheme cytochrome c family protein